jgi:hypothetical protein
MNTRFLISSAAVIVLLVVFGYLVHGILLAGDYARLPNLYRSPEEQTKYLPFVLAAQVIAGVALVWLYRRRRNSRPTILQGMRFGLAVAALMVIPKFLIYYAIEPLPGTIVVKQIVFDTIIVTVIGIVVAYLNLKEG